MGHFGFRTTIPVKVSSTSLLVFNISLHYISCLQFSDVDETRKQFENAHQPPHHLGLTNLPQSAPGNEEGSA